MSVQAVELLNADPMVKKRIRFANFSFVLNTGAQAWTISVADGQLSLSDESDRDTPDFRIEFQPGAWDEAQKEFPRPGFHDLSSLVENGNVTTTGDLVPLFTYLFVVKDIVSQIARGRFI